MSQSQAKMRQRLIEAAASDPRIVGLLNDGSHCAGRGDEWSDIDVSVFIRDEDYDAFARDWIDWASQFGDLLLGYISYVGHPWTVYDALPVPLRVDFDFHRESEIDKVTAWPVSPVSIEAILWYDGTGGRLRGDAEQLVGKSLRPLDLREAFDRTCGDFWYAMLFTFSKLQRGEEWVARQALHCRTMEPMLRLLRLEAEATERWLASDAATAVQQSLTKERLSQLESCIPAAGEAELRRVLGALAQLGQETCDSIARRHNWLWPDRLAARILASFKPLTG